jgi:hypothetical protein
VNAHPVALEEATIRQQCKALQRNVPGWLNRP